LAVASAFAIALAAVAVGCVDLSSRVCPYAY